MYWVMGRMEHGARNIRRFDADLTSKTLWFNVCMCSRSIDSDWIPKITRVLEYRNRQNSLADLAHRPSKYLSLPFRPATLEIFLSLFSLILVHGLYASQWGAIRVRVFASWKLYYDHSSLAYDRAGNFWHPSWKNTFSCFFRCCRSLVGVRRRRNSRYCHPATSNIIQLR